MREQYIINAQIYMEGQFRTGVLEIREGTLRYYPAGCEIPPDVEEIGRAHV